MQEKKYATLLQMTEFSKQIKGAKDLTIADQKKAGTPIAGAMNSEHAQFLQTLEKLINEKTIDPQNAQTFLNTDVYANLDEQTQDKADLALQNMARQIQLIHGFIESNETPNESPQLQTMVEQLWQMKQEIEIDNDVFVF